MSVTVVEETFGTRFKEIIENLKINQNNVAKKAGIDEGLFSRILNKGRESEFYKIFMAVKYITDVDKSLNMHELMLLYIKDLKNYENIKDAMEYCDTHLHLEQLQKLCDYCYEKHNDQNGLKEWADFYSLSIKLKLNKLSVVDWNERIFELKPNCNELSVYRALSLYIIENHNRRFKEIRNSIGVLNEKADEIKSAYLRFSYKARIRQYGALIYLRSGELEKAEEHILELLKSSIGKRFDAFAWGTLAERNIHDKSKVAIAIKYYEKSIEIYKQLEHNKEVSILVNKIQFVKLIHGIDIPIEEIKKKQYIAFKHILNGDKKRGLEILNKLDAEEGKSPMRDYIRGRATGDKRFYWLALLEYMKNNDRLFGYFSMKELLALGELDLIVKGVYNIHMTESE
ncbi:AimR family lysis-lysogeny pheromone receptor [Bacillus sp. SM2101]|uniref:AimR family lysis-lysogeny pheromone receptor n=1 Tax=Bacillus sp. SM2101 TaxID=2805366 RepID=UPI001BDF0394